MKLKTQLARLDPHSKLYITNEKTNGYLYVGGVHLNCGTNRNEDFFNELCERKVKSVTAIKENELAIVLHVGA